MFHRLAQLFSFIYVFSTNTILRDSLKPDILTMKNGVEGKKVPLSKWKKLIWSSWIWRAMINISQYDQADVSARIR